MAQRTCTIDGCDRKHYARGLCNAHYLRKKRGAPMDTPIRKPTWRPRGTAEKFCTHPGCDRKHFARSYCSVHHYRWRVGSDMDAPIRVWAKPGQKAKCSEENCDRTSAARGLCPTHYGHWRKKYGTRCRIDGCDSVVQAQKLCHMHYAIQKNYNITAESWDSLYDAQQGKCAICDGAITKREAQTDHDHSCCPGTSNSCGSCVRGLLCIRCNQGLGNFRDSADRLRSAIQYLGRWDNLRLLTA